jgi:hypothetical protein
MASALGQSVGHGRPRASAKGAAMRPATARSTVAIVENPLAAQNAALAREVEADARGILGAQDLGRLEVRFRVCRDEVDGLKFICKVESPAPADLHQEAAQWRWWSPLMETAQDFREALLEAIDIRRQRLAAH